MKRVSSCHRIMHTIRRWSLPTLALLLPAFAHAQEGGPLAARVDSLFARYDRADAPGCATAVIRSGEVVLAKGYGVSNLEHGVPITPASIFHVASISKQFAAFAVALLAHEGALSLDDDVRRHVPELPDLGATITVRQLIHHTSGLRDQWSLLSLAGWRADDPKTEDDILDLLSRQRELNFTPGDQYLYSNSGYTLLAVIVKRISGRSLREFAEERIFAPLGMTSTHFHDDHTMIVPGRTAAYSPRDEGWVISIPVFDNHGATSLFTTVGDLAKWDGNSREPTVGTRALLDLVYTRGVLNDGERLPYAFGLVHGEHRGLRTVGHSGADAGYRADFIRFPDQDHAFATLCNAANTNPGALNRGLAEIYLADRMAPAPAVADPTPAPVEVADLEKYAGTYWDPRDEVARRVRVTAGKLVLEGGPGGELIPLGESRFQVTGQQVTLRFSPAAGYRGQVLEVTPANGRAARLESMDETPPTADELAQLAGEYHSPELATSWTVVYAGGALTLRRRKFPDAELTFRFRDAFASPNGLIRFQRGPGGRVEGFLLSAGRVRHLRFDRAPARPGG